MPADAPPRLVLRRLAIVLAQRLDASRHFEQAVGRLKELGAAQEGRQLCFKHLQASCSALHAAGGRCLPASPAPTHVLRPSGTAHLEFVGAQAARVLEPGLSGQARKVPHIQGAAQALAQQHRVRAHLRVQAEQEVPWSEGQEARAWENTQWKPTAYRCWSHLTRAAPEGRKNRANLQFCRRHA